MSRFSNKKLRIIVLMHEDLIPPDTIKGVSDEEMQPWKTEYDVMVTLRDMGHEVTPIGVYNDLGVIYKAIGDYKPHLAFNLVEEFHGFAVYDQHVASFLELMEQPYSGCNPRGLTLAHDKALSKSILTYHRVAVPRFAVFPMNRKIRRPKRLGFPLLVKSVSEEGSVGISQASIVNDDKKLQERVEFVHRWVETDAIAEQYIVGRELYVSVVGNQRLQVFPPWELIIKNLPAGAPHIATGKVKWNLKYQKTAGVDTRAARGLPEEIQKNIARISKRVYRILSLSGYTRLDFRFTEDGQLFLMEANPNPNLSYGDDFSESAAFAGVDYEQLLGRILRLGLTYQPLGVRPAEG